MKGTYSGLAKYVVPVAFALAGCGNEQPSQLERKVEAQAVVHSDAGTVQQKIDLSRPENPVKLYFQAIQDSDLKRGHELYLQISHEKELGDFNKWKKLSAKFELLEASVGTPVEQDKRWSVPNVMVYEERGRHRIDKSPFEVVLVDGKYKLATK